MKLLFLSPNRKPKKYKLKKTALTKAKYSRLITVQ